MDGRKKWLKISYGMCEWKNGLSYILAIVPVPCFQILSKRKPCAFESDRNPWNTFGFATCLLFP